MKLHLNDIHWISKTSDLSSFTTVVVGIGWITDDHAAASNIGARSNADQLAVLSDDLINWLVKHVRPAIDRA